MPNATPKDQSSKEELAKEFADEETNYDWLDGWNKKRQDFIAGYSACESQLTELREENERLRNELFDTNQTLGTKCHENKEIREDLAIARNGLEDLLDVTGDGVPPCDYRDQWNKSRDTLAKLTRSEAPECGAKGGPSNPDPHGLAPEFLSNLNEFEKEEKL